MELLRIIFLHFFTFFFYLKVADTALKCFACVTDRFTRKGVDPAPLAKHGLTDELLKKLVSSAMACGNNTSTSMNASMSESRSSSGNVSIIVSVLSMLCRGSPSITHVSFIHNYGYITEEFFFLFILYEKHVLEQ